MADECAGVCVLAATSRPDLLDAALLRPGRLDRLIYCGFPNEDERGQILHALARRLRLHGDVDLDSIGQQCEGYSGADLSALLSEAQLAAVHESLDGSEATAAPEAVWLNTHSACALACRLRGRCCGMNPRAVKCWHASLLETCVFAQGASCYPVKAS